MTKIYWQGSLFFPPRFYPSLPSFLSPLSDFSGEHFIDQNC